MAIQLLYLLNSYSYFFLHSTEFHHHVLLPYSIRTRQNLLPAFYCISCSILPIHWISYSYCYPSHLDYTGFTSSEELIYHLHLIFLTDGFVFMNMFIEMVVDCFQPFSFGHIVTEKQYEYNEWSRDYQDLTNNIIYTNQHI